MKIPKFIAAFPLLLSLSAFGQGNASLTDVQPAQTGPAQMFFASMVAGCGVADSLAKLDIKKQMPFLLLKGGIASVVHVPTDSLAEQKFQFHYYDFGCSGPDEACVLGYNQRIFEYLTSKYGKRWLKAVRRDVVGLKEWKRTQ
ncbi:hypothetical protein [Hymenobacter sp. BT559]|uniref:FEKKY domain-containing protein n=1 Tax=Hymenobacter sp. BT559 TaxID=2795729 RepID=UPI0018EAC5E4|nr:hypothetical protein [Hymenobacter sp. BT559]